MFFIYILRYMMLIDREDEIYFIDRDNSVFKAEGLRFPRRKEPDEHIANTLLDGVIFFTFLVNDENEGKS